MAGSGVHVSIGNAELLSDIRTDPVSGVLLVHRRAVNLVFARAWLIQVLSTSVKSHAEGELSLLLSDGVCLVGVARIREIEVAWDVVVGAWNTLVVVINLLLLLYVSNLGRQLGTVVHGRSLTALSSHAERCTS